MAADFWQRTRSFSLRYEDNALLHQSLLDMSKNDLNQGDYIPAFAAWNQGNEVSIENEENGHTAQTTLFTVYGQASLLFPQAVFLEGIAPQEGDDEGCAISSATAYKLFGSDEVLNQLFTWNDKEYRVCGVYDLPEDTMMMQNCNSESNIGYTGLEISTSGQEVKSVKTQAEEFTNRFGLSSSYVAYDYASQAYIMTQLALLPGLFILIFAVVRMGKTQVKLNNINGALSRTVMIAAACAFLVLGIWMIGPSVSIPTESLPARWSDFEYWGELWQTQAQLFVSMEEQPGYLPDIETKMVQYQMIACVVGAIVSSLFVVRKKNIPRTLSALLIYVLAALAMAFGAALWLKMQYSRGLWLIWPLYFLMQYLCCQLSGQDAQNNVTMEIETVYE